MIIFTAARQIYLIHFDIKNILYGNFIIFVYFFRCGNCVVSVSAYIIEAKTKMFGVKRAKYSENE